MVRSTVWIASADFPFLGEADVHLWRIPLELSGAAVQRLTSVLQSDERARADRFRFARDGRRFVVARAALRILLGGYLKVAPARVEFHYGAQGKPFLSSPDEGLLRLTFNLSHSHELALAAFARGRALGVDLEHVRTEMEVEEIAERFFSPGEVAVLRSLPAAVRHEAFFNCWTRKEAFIKARGEGLSLPLEQFDVTLAPTEAVRLVRTRWDEQEAARWTLQAFDVASEYKAAVAYDGGAARLSTRHAAEDFLLGRL